MFTDSGEIKLIDFGKACMFIEDNQYSVESDDCFSYDLFILTCSILEYNYIPILKPQFNALLTHGGKNIFNIMRLVTPRGKAIFHRAYTNYMDARYPPWDIEEIYEGFKRGAGLNFRPDRFGNLWKSFREKLIASMATAAPATPAAPPAPPAPTVTDTTTGVVVALPGSPVDLPPSDPKTPIKGGTKAKVKVNKRATLRKRKTRRSSK